jgi:hypothetical protein
MFYCCFTNCFRWPPNEIDPKSFVHGGAKVSVLAIQSNASMENQGLLEAIDYIGDIQLPTVIKIDEVYKGVIYKALKEFDWSSRNLEVIHYEQK